MDWSDQETTTSTLILRMMGTNGQKAKKLPCFALLLATCFLSGELSTCLQFWGTQLVSKVWCKWLTTVFSLSISTLSSFASMSTISRTFMFQHHCWHFEFIFNQSLTRYFLFSIRRCFSRVPSFQQICSKSVLFLFYLPNSGSLSPPHLEGTWQWPSSAAPPHPVLQDQCLDFCRI